MMKSKLFELLFVFGIVGIANCVAHLGGNWWYSVPLMALSTVAILVGLRETIRAFTKDFRP
jgi:putative effector of murein hydrolase LrgA (UPF0299 family)